MKKIITILLLLISTVCFSMTYADVPYDLQGEWYRTGDKDGEDGGFLYMVSGMMITNRYAALIITDVQIQETNITIEYTLITEDPKRYFVVAVSKEDPGTIILLVYKNKKVINSQYIEIRQ